MRWTKLFLYIKGDWPCFWLTEVCVNKEMQIADGFQPVAPLVYDIIGDLKRVTNSKGEGIAEFN
jgi:hypothetical protein